MNNFLKLFALGIFILVIAFACKKGFDSTYKELFSTQDAQEWFSSQKSLSWSGYNDNATLQKAPKTILWNYPHSFRIDNETILEFPVIFKNKTGITLSRSKQSVLPFEDVVIENKIIFKKDENGVISSAIMTIIPENDSRDIKNLISKENHYKNLGNQFNGLVLFYSWDGLFVGGWKYNSGRPIMQIRNIRAKEEKKNEDVSISPNLVDPSHCTTYGVTTWCIDCTDWYVNGQYQHTSCGNAYACGYFEYDECYPTSGNTGGGGGGGGSTGGWGENGGIYKKLCGTINFSQVGNSWTGTLKDLYAEFVEPSTGRWVLSYFSELCITIPNYNNTAAQASQIFKSVFNESVASVLWDLEDGTIPVPNPVNVKAALKTKMTRGLQYRVPGSKISFNQCLGNVAVSWAQLCPNIPNAE